MSQSPLDYDRLWREFDPWAAIPERYNLGAALTAGNVAAGRGDRVALAWENSAGETRQYTYAALDEATNRFASSLARLDVRRGDRVLLRLPNLPEFYIAALAVAKLGAVFIPTSTQFREAELEYRIRDSGAVAAVTTTGLAAEIHNVRPKCPTLKHLIAVPYADVPLAADQLSFIELVNDGEPKFEAADTANDDLAFIAYTSGTTGDPKGVVHLQRYPLGYDSLIRWWHGYQDDDICTCPAELGWLLPVASTFLYALRAGVRVVLYHPLDGRFDPAAWLKLIEKYGITNFVGTPTIYRLLTSCPDIGGANLSTLRHGVSAGEPLPPDTIAAVEQNLGFTPLDGIGMSECMVYCANLVGLHAPPGSCGRPTPGTVIRVLDDDLNEVPDGSEGVLCVRRDSHPGMLQGYWNKPEQTSELLRGDWYFSGDVVVRDSDGWFWFKGRHDDLIKASGYRISPFEVESCLVAHPAVLEAAVISSPDPMRGSVVKAVLVLRSGHAACDELVCEIQEWCKARMAPFKYPRKVEFVASLPKTTSGKTMRRILRDLDK